jgi:hypothetical protein
MSRAISVNVACSRAELIHLRKSVSMIRARAFAGFGSR